MQKKNYHQNLTSYTKKLSSHTIKFTHAKNFVLNLFFLYLPEKYMSNNLFSKKIQSNTKEFLTFT